MTKQLKSLDFLTVEELPLEELEGNKVIKEDNLENYLIKSNYNVYEREAVLTKQDVLDWENDYILDCTMIYDVMADLGFSLEEEDDDERYFVISC